jgi:hypothetical protein
MCAFRCARRVLTAQLDRTRKAIEPAPLWPRRGGPSRKVCAPRALREQTLHAYDLLVRTPHVVCGTDAEPDRVAHATKLRFLSNSRTIKISFGH